MSTIFLDFKLGSSEEDPCHISLQRLGSPASSLDADSNGAFVAKDGSRIHGGEICDVYRVNLLRGDKDPLDAVLKIAYWEDDAEAVIKEAQTYETEAKPLQGHLVPRCYGVFQGICDYRVLTCLVLEYCGERMQCSFAKAETKFKFALVEKLAALHKHGLEHGDMVERNIVVKNGEPFIIDLERTEPHVCGRSMPIYPNDFEPELGHFGCTELYWLARKMALWKPSVIRFYDSTIPLIHVDSAKSLYSLVVNSRLRTKEQKAKVMRDAERLVRIMAKERELYIERTGARIVKVPGPSRRRRVSRETVQ